VRLIAFLVLAFGAAVWTIPGVAEAQDIPAIPHEITGREKCLLCHSASGAVPVPANHSSYTEGLCLNCHQAVPAEEAPPPEEGEETPPASTPDNSASCEGCHGQAGLNMTLKNGETLSLYVDSGIFDNSIHGDKLLCTDCHTSISGFPHPQWEIESSREYALSQYELCKQCHFDNYTKTLDSIHYTVLSEGDLQSPICTDCHGAHDVSSPAQPRAKISQTCSQCHGTIYDQYVSSVHGTSLITENNYDVPVCTDCHQSHTIEDPRTASFRIESVELCSKCHSDAALMDKYGISPNVVKTYLNDFHGRTVALVEKQARDIWVEEAVCTDCHGIHDIMKADSPNSPVIKENLVATCGKCHEDVSANFPAAWLSHYEPSITNTPLIFFVRWFYRILIPFILAGLSVHILVDLWRRITNR